MHEFPLTHITNQEAIGSLSKPSKCTIYLQSQIKTSQYTITCASRHSLLHNSVLHFKYLNELHLHYAFCFMAVSCEITIIPAYNGLTTNTMSMQDKQHKTNSNAGCIPKLAIHICQLHDIEIQSKDDHNVYAVTAFLVSCSM